MSSAKPLTRCCLPLAVPTGWLGTTAAEPLGRLCPSHGGVARVPSPDTGQGDFLGLKSVVVFNH